MRNCSDELFLWRYIDKSTQGYFFCVLNKLKSQQVDFPYPSSATEAETNQYHLNLFSFGEGGGGGEKGFIS